MLPLTAAGHRLLNPNKSCIRILLGLFFALVIFYFFAIPSSNPHLHSIHQQIEDAQTSRIPIPPSHLLDSSAHPIGNCSGYATTTYLENVRDRFDLGESFQYAQREIRIHRQDIRRKSITKLDEDLFEQPFFVFDSQNPQAITKCMRPLDVTVSKSPFPREANASHLLIGISTTFERLMDPHIKPIREWAHWLTYNGTSNGAGLILRLVDATSEEIVETERMMKTTGIDAKVSAADGKLTMAERYLSLLPTLYNDESRDARKWLAMVDDDTFFPCMNALLDQLDDFDPEQDLYIGNLSEDVGSIERHGSQAFGGAGVFFSMSLAAKIAALYPICATQEEVAESDSGWGAQGDILLRKCIYGHTEARLSMLRGLYQLDIRGDASGFYEAGLKPLSLHHFKGGVWHQAPVYFGTRIMHLCGEDCYLQRFRTKDNFIISNGYSIAQYPKGIDFNLHQIERSFDSMTEYMGWNFDFMLGPQRMPLKETGRKSSWELKNSEFQTHGSLRQTYIRRKDDPRWVGPDRRAMHDRDGVLELVWLP